MASGNDDATSKVLRIGRSVRTVSQATGTEIATVAAVTDTANKRVDPSSERVRAEEAISHESLHPSSHTRHNR
jgi:hypothetical protein